MSEQEVAGCALGVQPLVSPIADAAESAQRALLEEARVAVTDLAAGPSRQLAENALVDYEQQIDSQRDFYAVYVEEACTADPHMTPWCTQGVIDVVGEMVRDTNRDLPLQADAVGDFSTGMPEIDAVQRLQVVEFELGGRLQSDATLVSGFSQCAMQALGEPTPG